MVEYFDSIDLCDYGIVKRFQYVISAMKAKDSRLKIFTHSQKMCFLALVLGMIFFEIKFRQSCISGRRLTRELKNRYEIRPIHYNITDMETAQKDWWAAKSQKQWTWKVL